MSKPTEIVNHALKSIWYHKGVQPRKKILELEQHHVERTWHLFDARNQPLGKMTTRIGKLLQGKHKPNFCMKQDRGDFVVVVNCFDVHLTDNQPRDTHVKDRFKTKIYRRHTGWPGGLKEITAFDWRSRRPEFLIEHAVKGQIPGNKFRQARLSRLLCYPGPVHPWTEVFPNHQELRWHDHEAAILDDSKVPELQLEDGWVYDNALKKRYTEVDGVVVEEDLPTLLPGFSEAAHPFPTAAFWDPNETEKFKKIEWTMREKKEQELLARWNALRELQARIEAQQKASN